MVGQETHATIIQGQRLDPDGEVILRCQSSARACQKAEVADPHAIAMRRRPGEAGRQPHQNPKPQNSGRCLPFIEKWVIRNLFTL